MDGADHRVDRGQGVLERRFGDAHAQRHVPGREDEHRPHLHVDRRHLADRRQHRHRHDQRHPGDRHGHLDPILTLIEAISTRSQRVGWYSYDWAISAFRATVITVFLGPYLTTIANRAAGPDGLVHPLGIPVATGSLFTYTVSASVLLTVPILPLVGALADRSSHKKRLLAAFAYLGAGSVIAMVFLTGSRYLLGAALLLVANIASGAAKVVFNAFLPEL